MLSVPLKTTDAKKVDWASALSRYVTRAYSKEHAAAHAEQFASVAALHKQCSDVLVLRQNVLDAAGRHSGGADPMGECAAVASLLRYYRLLCSLETLALALALALALTLTLTITRYYRLLCSLETRTPHRARTPDEQSSQGARRAT